MKLLARLGRYRNTLLLAFALALGGLAAFGARGYIASEIAAERERLQPRQDTVSIVVAKRALGKGDVASAETMAVREVPSEYVASGALRPERFDAYAGSRLAVPMRAGEPLLHGMLEGVDVSTFSAKVQAGIRALTIAVDEINSLSGMLQPGDHIDLLLSVRVPSPSGGAAPQELTRTLMQDVKVLATGRQVRPGGDERQARNYTAITVEVTPAQAQRLVVAQRSGKLTAMLRNPGDRDPIAQAPLDVYGLLDLSPARAATSTMPRTPDLIIGGHGPLKVVAGLAQANAGPVQVSVAPPGAPGFPGVAGAPGYPNVAGSTGSQAPHGLAGYASAFASSAAAGPSTAGPPATGTGAAQASGTVPAPSTGSGSSSAPLGGPAPLPPDSTSDAPSARTITIR